MSRNLGVFSWCYAWWPSSTGCYDCWNESRQFIIVLDTCGLSQVAGCRAGQGAVSCPGHYNDEQWIVAWVSAGPVFVPVFIISGSSSDPHASCQVPRPDIIIPGKLNSVTSVTVLQYHNINIATAACSAVIFSNIIRFCHQLKLCFVTQFLI